MHELGIVFHIISSLEQVGAQNHLRSISTVTLEIGEVSSVINSYLEDCWRWAADRSELLRGAALRIETIPAVTLCEGCGKTYGTVSMVKPAHTVPVSTRICSLATKSISRRLSVLTRDFAWLLHPSKWMKLGIGRKQSCYFKFMAKTPAISCLAG